MGRTWGPHSTIDDVLEGVDLTGRRAVITGATSGLGLEVARAFAQRDAQVVLVGRDPAKLAAAQASLAERHGPDRVRSVRVDLADLDTVRAGAQELRAAVDRIDLLINNAGVMVCPQGTTAQGHETQFGTNHLGHFAWTCHLAPLLTPNRARVVNLSSAAHRIGPVDLDDLDWRRRPYDRWGAYGASKTANVLFTVALHHRLVGRGVGCLAVHPGMIATDLARHMVPDDLATFTAVPEELKTVAQGAATTAWAATAPELAEVGPAYLADCAIAPVDDTEGFAAGVRSYALDPEAAEGLWGRSVALAGIDLAD